MTRWKGLERTTTRKSEDTRENAMCAATYARKHTLPFSLQPEQVKRALYAKSAGMQVFLFASAVEHGFC
jgi:hypothetical protein